MESDEVAEWFREYVNAFAACGRGEREPAALLAYCGVPLILATDAGAFALANDDEVVARAQQQVDGMMAASYDHSEILHSEVTLLNATSGLYRATYSRQRSDGAEISRVTVTYLATDGPAGRRISGLVVHSPDSVTT